MSYYTLASVSKYIILENTEFRNLICFALSDQCYMTLYVSELASVIGNFLLMQSYHTYIVRGSIRHYLSSSGSNSKETAWRHSLRIYSEWRDTTFPENLCYSVINMRPSTNLAFTLFFHFIAIIQGVVRDTSPIRNNIFENNFLTRM